MAETEVDVFCAFCGEPIPCSEMLLHIKNDCSEREVFCEYCHKRKKFSELEDHYPTCSGWPIKCTYCEMNLLQDERDSHESTCDLKPRPCYFAPLGCNYEGPKTKMHKHAQCVDHYESITRLVKQTAEKVHSLEAMNRSDKEYYARDQAEIQNKLNKLEGIVNIIINSLFEDAASTSSGKD